MTSEEKTLDVDKVTFDQTSYPREKPKTSLINNYADALEAGFDLPPIHVDRDGLVLLDGYHRWKAHQERGKDTIEAKLIDLDGMPRLLYAARQNAFHGEQLTNADKKNVAQSVSRQILFPDSVEDDDSIDTSTAVALVETVTGEEVDASNRDEITGRQVVEMLIDSLGASESTLYEWAGDVLNRRKRQRNAKIWWLKLLGWTTREIGSVVDVSISTVSDVCSEIPDLEKAINDAHSRGRTPIEIGEEQDVFPKLVEVLLMKGKSDQARMSELGVGIQPYDVWTFSGCDNKFGEGYPGRIPGQIVLHTLYFYTDPGDVVIDPMVGSGTTIDACAYMGRDCYGYDAHPIDSRFDIEKHDMLEQGWPSRTKDADLIFWDPPYYKKKKDEYKQGSISALSGAEYGNFFDQMAGSIPDQFSGKLAFLCSDYNDEEGQDDVFFWQYVNAFRGRGWKPVRRIQVPLSTQQIHADVVTRFRKEKRLARLNRDLLILKR